MRKHKGLAGVAMTLAAGALALAGCGNGSAAVEAGATSADGSASGAAARTADGLDAAAQGTTVDSAPSAADGLQLTADQQAQAQAIFNQLKTDAEALRTAAHEQVRTLLTDAQRATLDIVAPPIALPADDAVMGSFGGGPAHGGPGFPGGRAFGPDHDVDASLPADFVDALGLTAEQQTSIETFLSDLHASLQARRDQAQSDFEAILTDEQAAALDDAALPPHGRAFGGHGAFGRRGHAGGPGRPDPLQLSDEQQTQADAIFTQTRTDVATLVSDARAAARSALSAEQLAVIDAIETTAPQPGRGFRGHKGLNLPAGLTESLNLSIEQAATIDGIAQGLRSSLSGRHAQADADFRAILTADQIAQLDQLGRPPFLGLRPW